MKILTLNTHSLLEKDYQQKLIQFAHLILQEQPGVVALQEVNQTISAPAVPRELLQGYVPADTGAILRQDNHVMNLAALLRIKGLSCRWTWLPVKLGYERYDEGLALMSFSRPIRQTNAFRISRCSDYNNWKTRKALGIRLTGMDDWFYTVHMGWWNDAEEPFDEQWKALSRGVAAKMTAAPIWLTGDFNGPAEVRGESYDCIQSAGWYDTYLLAKEKDCGITVEGIIDGWRDKVSDSLKGMRIDQIWSSCKVAVKRSKVVCNGVNGPVISDHYGVLIETEGGS